MASASLSFSIRCKPEVTQTFFTTCQRTFLKTNELIAHLFEIPLSSHGTYIYFYFVHIRFELFQTVFINLPSNTFQYLLRNYVFIILFQKCFIPFDLVAPEIILKWFYWISSITTINSFINWTKCSAQITELGHLAVFTAPHNPLGKGGFVVAVVHGSNFLMGSFEPRGFCFFWVSGSLGWPQTHYVAREHRIVLNSWSPCLHPYYGKDCGPEPLLPPPPWVYWFLWCWGTNPGLGILGKHATEMSPSPRVLFREHNALHLWFQTESQSFLDPGAPAPTC